MSRVDNFIKDEYLSIVVFEICKSNNLKETVKQSNHLKEHF